MSVQHKVITRGSFNPDDKVLKEDASSDTGFVEVSVTGPQGTLATGVPGNLLDVTPMRVVTDTAGENAKIGGFVSGKGVIVNTREYASVGQDGDPLKPTLKIPSGTTVSYCTFGHVIMERADAEAISGMNKRYVEGYDPTKGVGSKIYVRKTEENETADGGFTAANWAEFDPTATAADYAASKDYAVGDIVKNSSKKYVCKTAVTTSTNWSDDGDSFAEITETPVAWAYNLTVGKTCYITEPGICTVELSGFSA